MWLLEPEMERRIRHGRHLLQRESLATKRLLDTYLSHELGDDYGLSHASFQVSLRMHKHPRNTNNVHADCGSCEHSRDPPGR